MTPKEKAEELVNKYKPHSYNGAIEETDELMELFHAKQCALIAVDEIIKEVTPKVQLYTYQLDFWQQVKQEIEQL